MIALVGVRIEKRKAPDGSRLMNIEHIKSALPSLLSISVVAVFLAWPAWFNGYPILFVDSAHYLLQGRTGEIPWDKTAAYGLFLTLLHGSFSLWIPVLVQALLLSHMLWLVQRVACGAVTPWRHLLLCGAVAALTSAPWFVALLMPDHFAPILVLCLFLLGFGEARLAPWERAWAGCIATLAILVHLSHLPLALALLVLVVMLRRRVGPVLRCAAPLLVALLILIGTNWLTLGRATLSPHGAVFLLARFQEDGSAVRSLRERCPSAGWYLCDFIGEMPMDTDRFLWNPHSPANQDAQGRPRADGLVRLAPEAAEIVAATLRDRPAEVARDVLMNGTAQIFRTRLRDTFGVADLGGIADQVLRPGFPPRETAAFLASAQMRGGLEALPLGWLHQMVLWLAAAVILAGWWRLARVAPQQRDLPRLGLVIFVLVGVMGNAFATGPLSKPHDRYQSRIAWLLPLGAMIAFWPVTARLDAQRDGIRPAPARPSHYRVRRLPPPAEPVLTHLRPLPAGRRSRSRAIP